MSSRGARLAVTALEALIIFGVAAALRAAGLGEGALHDELFNFLAAEGLVQRGEMTLVPGGEPYTRGALFTHVVAHFLRAFGDSLAVGRIPALLAGSLLAAATFLWLRAMGERAAGWIAGLLIAADPMMIQLSQVVRFYSFQHLLFLLGVMAGFSAFVRARAVRRALPFAALSAIAFLAAVHLQPVSLIGIGGVFGFLAVAALRAVGEWPSVRVRRRWIVGAALAIVAAGVLVWIQRHRVQALIDLAGFVDIWAADDAGNLRYYYVTMYDGYAPLWALFPLLALYAVVRRPSAAGLSAIVFGTGFVVHSLLPWKADRYLSYLLPFFFIVVGLGLVHALPQLRRLVTDLCRALAWRIQGARYVRALSMTALVGLIVFASASNRAFLDTAQLVTREHAFAFPRMGPRDGTLSWSRFADRIGPMLDSVDVVVSSDDLKALHYLGRVDYAVSPSRLYTTDGWQPEFWFDARTRVRVVREAASLAGIMACHRSGLYMAQRMSVHSGVTGRAEPTEYVAEHAEPIDLPAKWGMVAYRWRADSRPAPNGARCAAIAPPAAVPTSTD